MDSINQLPTSFYCCGRNIRSWNQMRGRGAISSESPLLLPRMRSEREWHPEDLMDIEYDDVFKITKYKWVFGLHYFNRQRNWNNHPTTKLHNHGNLCAFVRNHTLNCMCFAMLILTPQPFQISSLSRSTILFRREFGVLSGGALEHSALLVFGTGSSQCILIHSLDECGKQWFATLHKCCAECLYSL